MKFARTLCALVALTLISLTSVACSYHDRGHHHGGYYDRYDRYDGGYRHHGDHRHDRHWR